MVGVTEDTYEGPLKVSLFEKNGDVPFIISVDGEYEPPSLVRNVGESMGGFDGGAVVPLDQKFVKGDCDDVFDIVICGNDTVSASISGVTSVLIIKGKCSS
mmetsp:Transcript_8395/g.12143  ORF Transcript_8395/g.12143 Transcript_8395/m.12143 type:complete len:101 (-) Transcript_8395:1520-1822(-)